MFFRNNHFNVLFAHNGELMTLVTDQGYLHEEARLLARPAPMALRLAHCRSSSVVHFFLHVRFAGACFSCRHALAARVWSLQTQCVLNATI